MSLDRVVEEILDNARKEAGKLVTSAEAEKQAILKAAGDNAANSKKVVAKETDDAVRRLRQQEISSAELEEKRIVLNAKKEMLDRTLQEVNAEIANMSPSDKARLYNVILENGQKVIPGGKVYCPIGEAKLINARPGLKVQEVEMGPGLVLESQDGAVRIDYTFKAILDGVWEKELKNVSNILFG